MSELNADVTELKRQLDERKQRLAALQARQDELEGTIEKHQEEHGRAIASGSNAAEVMGLLRNARDELEGVSAAIPILETEINQFRDQLTSAQVREADRDAATQLETARGAVQQVAEELSKALIQVLHAADNAELATQKAIQAERRADHLAKRGARATPRAVAESWQQYPTMRDLIQLLRAFVSRV